MHCFEGLWDFNPRLGFDVDLRAIGMTSWTWLRIIGERNVSTTEFKFQLYGFRVRVRFFFFF
jgi:hypothetical protein